MTWFNPLLTLRALAAGAALGLVAGLLPVSGALADSPAHFFKKSGVRADRFVLTEADIEGKTLQRIASVGLRWMSFESGGQWRAANEKDRPISGTWEIRDGALCVTDRVWFPRGNCYSFYGSPDELSGVVSTGKPDVFQPASLFRTDDPTDGVGVTMPATFAYGGAYPFPVRTAKLFTSAAALSGWRLDVTDGLGTWFEFHPGGRLQYGDHKIKSERGKWWINEYGDACFDAKKFWNSDSCFDLLGGTTVAEITGTRDYGLPFRYFPTRPSRIAGN